MPCISGTDIYIAIQSRGERPAVVRESANASAPTTHEAAVKKGRADVTHRRGPARFPAGGQHQSFCASRA
jgi:hypothetical protein